MVDIYIKDVSGNIIFREKMEFSKVNELLLLVKKFTIPQPSLSASGLTEKETDTFTGIAEMIGKELSKNFSIQELADHAGMNRTKLQAGFKQVYKKTINSFTQDLKMERAKVLLTGTQGFGLKEIAGMLGYRYTNHFSAAFKKKFGISPSTFKNSNSRN